jgi:large-conductance mechanosensitive channel
MKLKLFYKSNKIPKWYISIGYGLAFLTLVSGINYLKSYIALSILDFILTAIIIFTIIKRKKPSDKLNEQIVEVEKYEELK